MTREEQDALNAAAERENARWRASPAGQRRALEEENANLKSRNSLLIVLLFFVLCAIFGSLFPGFIGE